MMPARPGAAVLTAVVVLLPVTGCDAVNGVTWQVTGHRQVAAATRPAATSIPQRLEQSGLREKVDLSGAQTRVAKGAMLVATSGQAIPEGLAKAAEHAATAVRDLGSHVSQDPLLVLVPRTGTEYAAWTGQKLDNQLANTVTGGGRAAFIVLAPPTVKEPDTTSTKETMVHEAFHAMTLDGLRTNRPLWLIEGWAEYVGQRTVPSVPHRLDKIDPHIPSDAELRGPNASKAYYEAFTFARYLRDVYGHEKMMRFYCEAVATKTTMDTLLRRYFGAGQAELDRRYAAWYPTFR